jgi:hypothetical protein
LKKLNHYANYLLVAVFLQNNKSCIGTIANSFTRKKGADMYIVDFNLQVGFKEQKDILNTRKVKKLAGYRVSKFPKKVLDNGDFYFKINAYLGHFAK